MRQTFGASYTESRKVLNEKEARMYKAEAIKAFPYEKKEKINSK
jgi:hypothetical protein